MYLLLQTQVARGTHAYPTWLTIFGVLTMVFLSVLRVISGMQGYLQSLIFSVAIIEAQFAWPTSVLWQDVRCLELLLYACLCTETT